jgi:IclR family pca regulon transcriptional regulator
MPTRKKPAAAPAPVQHVEAKSKSAEGHPDYMLSLARGLSVIGAFGLGGPRLSIAEVARLTGMSRAAARRCIYTLSILGYVRGVDGVNGGYELAPRILTLGHAYLGSASVAQAAQPVLERVAQRLHESCSLAVLDGDDIVYVARASIQRVLSVGLSVGSRLLRDAAGDIGFAVGHQGSSVPARAPRKG